MSLSSCNEWECGCSLYYRLGWECETEGNGLSKLHYKKGQVKYRIALFRPSIKSTQIAKKIEANVTNPEHSLKTQIRRTIYLFTERSKILFLSSSSWNFVIINTMIIIATSALLMSWYCFFAKIIKMSLLRHMSTCVVYFLNS